MELCYDIGELWRKKEYQFNGLNGFKNSIKKNGLALSIAPLQLLTLAVFPPWGSSEGAGRRRLTQRKSSIF